MGIKEEDFIKFLDEYMSGDGRSIKPQVDENGEITYFTASENTVSEATKDYRAGAENRGNNLFSDDVDDDCPTCANIPNTFDNDFDDEW